MTKRRSFATRLLSWFDTNKRDLPWRRDRTPYSVLVAEVMLQQTTSAGVLPYYERFLARFPDWEALACARSELVLSHWAGLGYYRRARSLHQAAKQIVERHAGSFPRDPALALTLPGVGPYTAGAVLSIAHGIPAAAVDGNVGRVLSRHRGKPWIASRAKDRREIEEVVRGEMPTSRAGDFTEALMELGATTCTPRSPACASCPVSVDCVARIEGRIAELPPRPARMVTRNVAAAAAVVLERGRVLLRRRPADSELLAGLWELPGGFLDGEAPENWIAREVLPALGGGSTRGILAQVRHVITNRRITVHLVECSLRRMPAHADDVRTCTASEARALGVSAATSKALVRLGL